MAKLGQIVFSDENYHIQFEMNLTLLAQCYIIEPKKTIKSKLLLIVSIFWCIHFLLEILKIYILWNLLKTEWSLCLTLTGKKNLGFIWIVWKMHKCDALVNGIVRIIFNSLICVKYCFEKIDDDSNFGEGQVTSFKSVLLNKGIRYPLLGRGTYFWVAKTWLIALYGPFNFVCPSKSVATFQTLWTH